MAYAPRQTIEIRLFIRKLSSPTTLCKALKQGHTCQTVTYVSQGGPLVMSTLSKPAITPTQSVSGAKRLSVFQPRVV